MKILNAQDILNKIDFSYDCDSDTDVYECDNKPNPYGNLTLDELIYVRDHKEIIEMVRAKRAELRQQNQ